MDIILWIFIWILFLLSFIGIIFPLIPSVLAIWLGFGTYYFFIAESGFGIFFWIAMIIITIILVLADVVTNSYFVRKLDGSKWGERAAAIAVIVGSFIYPPFGILLLPPIVVFLVELSQKNSGKSAFKAAIGSFIGFLSGAIAKILLQLIMIIWFLAKIIF